jgi:hypothetical protein
MAAAGAGAGAGPGVYPVSRAEYDSMSCWSTMDGVYLGHFLRKVKHSTRMGYFNFRNMVERLNNGELPPPSSTYIFQRGSVDVHGETLPVIFRPPMSKIRKVECEEQTYQDYINRGFSNKDARFILGMPLAASDAAAVAEPAAAVAAEPPKVAIQEQTYIADWKKRESGAWVLQCPKCGGAGTSAKPEVIKHKPECIYGSKLLKFKAVPSGPKPTNGGKRTRRRRATRRK